MIRWRQGSNGVLLAPSRGQAPACPCGYERVSGMNFQCQPAIECKYREARKTRQGCCHWYIVYYCHRIIV